MARVDVSRYQTFGDITERLDSIVSQVRDKDVSLERSLDLFDEAIALGSKAVSLVDATDFSPEEEARLAEEPGWPLSLLLPPQAAGTAPSMAAINTKRRDFPARHRPERKVDVGMDLAAQFETLSNLAKSGTELTLWQDIFVKFYQAFLEGDRWQQYIQGVGTTLLVTAMALALGVVLGGVVALIRVAHDQQRPGHRNPVLGVVNLICKIYSTVIRGTPMMVQLLIMSMVIFKSSREYTLVGALSLGINSGAYVSEIIRGGLMAVDPGQMEAGRSLGLNYTTTMVNIVIPQAIKSVLPALGNEFIVLLKDTSLITVIGGKELLYAAKGIMNRTYEAMYPLLGIAAIYLVLVMVFTWLLGKLEGRMRQSDRR